MVTFLRVMDIMRPYAKVTNIIIQCYLLFSQVTKWTTT